MSESRIFEWLAEELERTTPLSRLEARGTVRLVLKDAGLDPATVSPAHLGVVITRLMPEALRKRKVPDSEALCERLLASLRAHAAQAPEPVRDTAYDVFERLGRDPSKERKQP